MGLVLLSKVLLLWQHHMHAVSVLKARSLLMLPVPPLRYGARSWRCSNLNTATGFKQAHTSGRLALLKHKSEGVFLPCT
jgi:hypothetical protein